MVLLNSFRTLILTLPARRRTQLIWLMGFMLVGAFAEVLSLGAIIPFLAILADPAQALERPFIARVVATLGLSQDEDVRWQLTLLFIGAAVTAGVIRFVLIYVISRVNYGIGHELGAEVYRRTLYQPYEAHITRNTSEIVGGLNKVDIVVVVLLSLLTSISAILMALFIIVALILIDPVIATVALLGFGIIYGIVFVITRKRLAKNSQVLNSTYNTRVQAMQEGLGGIRDVLLDQAQPQFLHRFNVTDWAMRQAQASNNFLGPSPRFVVEALGMVLIALLGYYMTIAGGGVVAAIPTLGALALGAQRLMPLLQQTYQGWAYLAGNINVVNDVVALLQQPIKYQTEAQLLPLPFEREVRLKKVSFSYQSHLPPVLHELDLTIPKGARVGFVGATGSGKSTALDLLMGLLQPSEGQVLVDDTPLTGVARLAWQRNIAHVPQTIFLTDASFADNIAFGIPEEEIDMKRVRIAAQQAQIAEFIELNSEGYAAKVGERGIRLSGGQRQRIGIARALYKNAKLLILDEATSALDSETEQAVMHSINNLEKELTVLIIAHRTTTLSGCDAIYQFHNGGIISEVFHNAP